MVQSRCSTATGWEALRADPLPWLLDGPPNVRCRVLVDLVGRPESSPAVRRARSSADSCPVLESVLRNLSGATGEVEREGIWRRYRGLAWTLIAATQFGADPEDPRLEAPARLVLSRIDGDGAFARTPEGRGLPCVTARLAQALLTLGWGGHLRVREAVAWLAEGEAARFGGGWACPDPRHAGADGGCLVTASAVLAMHSTAEARDGLTSRAAESLARSLYASPARLSRLAHPNLMRTDLVEIFAALAATGLPWEKSFRPALEVVQRAQDRRARWRPSVDSPASLGLPAVERPFASRWITLSAVRALMTYAEPAGLERLFPAKPGSSGP